MTAVSLLLGLVDGAARTPVSPPHRRVRVAPGLDALVLDTWSQAEGDHESAALDWAMAQATILSAYAARDDVLPVALGAAFSSDDALVAHLEGIAPWIATKRAALAGATEFVVAIDARDMPTPAIDEGTGNDYLRRRKAQRDARRMLEVDRSAFATRVITALGNVGAQLADPRAVVRNSLVTVSALLNRSDIPAAASALEELAPEGHRLGLAVRMVGPCAPFSFVSPEPDHA